MRNHEPTEGCAPDAYVTRRIVAPDGTVSFERHAPRPGCERIAAIGVATLELLNLDRQRLAVQARLRHLRSQGG